MMRTIRIMASVAATLLMAAPGLRAASLRQVTKDVTKMDLSAIEVPPLPKADATHRTIEVPLVYARPEEGTFRLYYETNSDFHLEWRTLFVLHDGQQQPNIPGDPDKIKKEYGLERINVVRMEHRGMPWSRIGSVFTDGGVDWRKAWAYFRSANVVEDIDRIRVDLLGPDGRIFVLGGSGAGVLACEYLARYSSHVDRALIYVATDNLPSANRRQREKFFDLLRAERAMDAYLAILEAGPVPRGEFLWILQRLGYDFLPSENKEVELIRSLEAGDRSLYDRYAEEFQDVDKIVGIINAQTPFSAVRIFEMSFEILELSPPDPSHGLLVPLTRPLQELARVRAIRPEIINVRPALSAIPTEVLLATARWDHVMPYEEMVEMNKNMPRSRLLLIDDLHKMKKAKPGLLKLVPLFFQHGAFSPEFESALESGICPIWKDPRENGSQAGSFDVSGIDASRLPAFARWVDESGRDPVAYAVDKCRKHDVVIFGETHARKEQVEFFRTAALETARQAGVRVIALECCNQEDDEKIRRLVNGTSYDMDLAYEIARSQGWGLWGYQEYWDILEAVWKFNRSLPAGSEPLTVVGIDRTFDKQLWDLWKAGKLRDPALIAKARSQPDIFRRDDWLKENIEREILAKGLKGVVLVGFNHSFTHYSQPDFDNARKDLSATWPRMGVLLHDKYGDRVFQIGLHTEFLPSPILRKGDAGGAPIITEFLENVMALRGGTPVGFDFPGSPFAPLRDNRAFFFYWQPKATLADVIRGYVFLGSIKSLTRSRWMKDYVSEEMFARSRDYYRHAFNRDFQNAREVNDFMASGEREF